MAGELELETIFGSRMDSVMNTYVGSDGNVDYLTLARGDDVTRYVESLKTFDMASLETRNDKLAFWINAYNMLTLYGIIESIRKNPDFAKKGRRSILGNFRFFVLNKYTIGGKKYNLAGIENKILRKKCREPRIHFALGCGTGSCPPLKDGLYSGADIDRELDIAANIFINSPKGSRLDKENNMIYLSRIFKWYGKDFGGRVSSVLGFIARYHVEKEYIEKNMDNLRIEYMGYNWGLNIKR